MDPSVSLVIEVKVATEVAVVNGAVVVETMEETGLMDHWRWWRQEVL